MTEDTNEPQPKIIIDEDWKSQAQAEKERLARQQATSESAATSGSTAEPATHGPTAHAQEPASMQLPEASLTALVSMLASQVMVALGFVPHPLTGKPERSLLEAKYLIDLITMLEAKTQGNRTPQEISILSSVLHELRMAYVEAQSAPAPSSPPTSEASS